MLKPFTRYRGDKIGLNERTDKRGRWKKAYIGHCTRRQDSPKIITVMFNSLTAITDKQ